MAAYYNEIDPYAAQWLRNLIDAGHIAQGDVDERSIIEVRADDLQNYTQCHFFAGLGGWSYALRLAGWPDDRPVWTGSCPCQPFSEGGKRVGFQDTRDLWPAWFKLICERSPAIIFGEQVTGATVWIDRMFANLEDQNYEVGAAILPACAVDAPHRRDRIWFVADAEGVSGGRNIEKRETQERALDGWAGATISSPNFWWSGHPQVGWNAVRGRARSDDIQTTQWRIGPGVSLLADGILARVAKLRALGNAIVPQVAAEFIGAVMTLSSTERSAALNKDAEK